MAMYETTRPLPLGAITFGRLGHMFTTAADMFGNWNQARKTRAVLNALTDRELDDIGLSRGDIDNFRF